MSGVALEEFQGREWCAVRTGGSVTQSEPGWLAIGPWSQGVRGAGLRAPRVRKSHRSRFSNHPGALNTPVGGGLQVVKGWFPLE